MRFNGTTVPTHRDDTYDTSEVSRYHVSSGGDIEVEALNVTENGTYTASDGKAYSPVNVNVEGGSSDFSTAEVTINCTSGTLTFPAGTPHIVNGELVVDSFSITPNNDVVLTMPLYKNKLVIPQPLFPTVSSVPTTTGAITLDFGTGIVIQGDGTISAAGM